MTIAPRPKVVIIGAGFGGLNTARALINQPVDVLLIDRNNYHVFTPLLYQVATCGLDPSDIAYPVRGIFRRAKNVHFLLGSVTGIDTAGQVITVKTELGERSEPYDTLVVAAGSVTTYFGSAEIQAASFEIKDLTNAVQLRNHVLKLLERAAWTDNAEERRALTTMVVVGGGPTGLETAGALVELYNGVVKQEYPQVAHLDARVMLVEATDRVLAPFPEKLRDSAVEQLKSLGVEVLLGVRVSGATDSTITLSNGVVVPAHTLVWAAGVEASPLAKALGVETTRGGRIAVNEALHPEGLPNVYVIGDLAYRIDPKTDQPYPQMIPVAIQQAKHTAKDILARLKGQTTPAFTYFDKGIMATIGRSRAVAYPFNRVQLTGWLAWVTWLGLHLIWLMGFRNQVQVFINWLWNYLTYDRSVRIILENTAVSRTKPGQSAAKGSTEAIQHTTGTT
ncbi:MAG: NAD(P)/FAD-dependent oxidoreductase [Anaerolineae bacterium]|jgi:NADH dehydrogenase|nr:NAD(P)/FAD-dependent oxidoreductase [Anaerolineae bacterium]